MMKDAVEVRPLLLDLGHNRGRDLPLCYINMVHVGLVKRPDKVTHLRLQELGALEVHHFNILGISFAKDNRRLGEFPDTLLGVPLLKLHQSHVGVLPLDGPNFFGKAIPVLKELSVDKTAAVGELQLLSDMLGLHAPEA